MGAWPGGRAECACAAGANKSKEDRAARRASTRIAVETEWLTVRLRSCEAAWFWLSFANERSASADRRHEPGTVRGLRRPVRPGWRQGPGAASHRPRTRQGRGGDQGGVDQPPGPLAGVRGATGDAAPGHRGRWGGRGLQVHGRYLEGWRRGRHLPGRVRLGMRELPRGPERDVSAFRGPRRADGRDRL